MNNEQTNQFEKILENAKNTLFDMPLVFTSEVFVNKLKSKLEKNEITLDEENEKKLPLLLNTYFRKYVINNDSYYAKHFDLLADENNYQTKILKMIIEDVKPPILEKISKAFENNMLFDLEELPQTEEIIKKFQKEIKIVFQLIQEYFEEIGMIEIVRNKTASNKDFCLSV